MCGGAGGGAPWRQWGDGGRHGRGVFYFSSLHLANCVSGVRPLKNQQKTNQSDRLVIYIATPQVTKYLRTIQRNWSMIEKTAFKAYSFWWFRQQSTGNKEIKLAVLFGFNRGIWPSTQLAALMSWVEGPLCAFWTLALKSDFTTQQLYYLRKNRWPWRLLGQYGANTGPIPASSGI
jgi:hypothetical protein